MVEHRVGGDEIEGGVLEGKGLGDAFVQRDVALLVSICSSIAAGRVDAVDLVEHRRASSPITKPAPQPTSSMPVRPDPFGRSGAGSPLTFAWFSGRKWGSSRSYESAMRVCTAML